MIRTTENSDLMLIMGDFNARVGRGDPETSTIVGPCGPADINDAGDRLIELCQHHNLNISSTYHPKASRGSWLHAPSKKWYLIDHIVVKQRDANLVTQAIPIIPAECDTDHRLLRAKIQIKPIRTRFYNDPPAPRGREPKLKVASLKDDEIREKYNREVRVQLGKEIMQPNTNSNHTDITIYSDGSSTGRRPEERKGGWAFVIVKDDTQTALHYGPVTSTDVEFISNNSAELMAAKQLLLWLTSNEQERGATVTIRPDSMLVIKWLTGAARSGHHKELIKDCRGLLAKLRERIIIKWRHIRAHQGHHFNEMVDEHAKAGADGRSSAFAPRRPPQPVEFEASVPPDDARHRATCFAAALRAAGLTTLGTQEGKRTPQWMKDNEDKIQKLIADKNTIFDKLCANPDSDTAKNAYKRSCHKYRDQLRMMLNDWWTARAEQMEAASAGKLNPEVWAAIPELRAVLRKPGKCNTLNDTQGTAIPSAEWHNNQSLNFNQWHITRDQSQHFKATWNVDSQVPQHLIDMINQREVATHLDAQPTDEEIIEARACMRNKKAAGEDDVAPELVKALDETNLQELSSILRQCWGKPPSEWRDAVIVPIHKGGKKPKANTDNYRGIALLAVIGKLFTRVIATRIKAWAEEHKLLPEEQCGYRKNRGTLDLITVLQCTADAFKDASKELHVACVDLRKAFDSVNREAMYQVLGKLGIPPAMLDIIKKLHDGLEAKVFAEGALSAPFKVNTGDRQGCCLAPLLFLLYFATVIKDWKNNVQTRTVLKSRIDGHLHRSFTGGAAIQDKEHLTEISLVDAEFADDLMVFAESAENLHSMVTSLHNKMREWGLTMSDKTELLTFGGTPTDINVGPFTVKEADDANKGGDRAGPGNFKYVGSTFSKDGELFREIELRIRSGWAAMGKFTEAAWNVKQIRDKVKGKIWEAAVLPAVLYGLGARALAPRHVNKLQRFQDSCARQVLHLTRLQQHQGGITNENLRERLGWRSMEWYCTTDILRHVGHIMRLNNDRLPKQCLFSWHPTREDMPPTTGGHHQSYKQTVSWALKARNIPQKLWAVLASDRTDAGKRNWKKIIKTGFESGPVSQPTREDPAQKTVTCPECGGVFKVIALPAHYTKVHKGPLGQESWDSWCERHNIERRPTARRRDRPSAASQMEQSPGGRFHCDHEGCTETFRTVKQLTAHKLKHKVRQPHEIVKCHFCGHPCKGPGGLSKHIELRHSAGLFRDKTHKCEWPECEGRTFAIPAHLTRHINNVHEGRRTPADPPVLRRPAAAAKPAAKAVLRRPAANPKAVRRRPAAASG